MARALVWPTAGSVSGPISASSLASRPPSIASGGGSPSSQSVVGQATPSG
jgi:hypothetical protein